MEPLYLWLMSGLLVAALAVLLPPAFPRSDELWPSEHGYLRRGSAGAVLTALAALRERRMIAFGRNGVRQTGKGLPRGGDPFQRTIYNALYTPTGPRALATLPSVRAARANIAERLTALGLIPGRGRRWLGRLLLVALLAVALVGLTTGHTSTPTFVIAVLITAATLRLTRRTLAGHIVVFTGRHEHKELLGKLDGVSHSTRGWYNPTDYSSYGSDHTTPSG